MTPLPATIQPGESKTLQFKFVPTEVRDYTETAKLKKSDGSILYIVNLKGKGIISLPIITSFYPGSGSGGTTINIYGDNFIDVTDVRVGNASVMFDVISPMEISAVINSNVSTGAVEVYTSSGYAVSSAVFFKTFGGGGPRDPNDPRGPEMPINNN